MNAQLLILNLTLLFSICLAGSQTDNGGHQKVVRCSRKSAALARQVLARELEQINNYNTFWFSDLDEEELNADQKRSLSSIIMSDGQLLVSGGRPLLELEASYLRPMSSGDQLPAALLDAHSPLFGASNGPQPISIRLAGKHADRCTYASAHFQLTFGLTLGPIEHNLDVVYNLDKELSLSQPINWRYAQVKIIVPRMNYEVTLRQSADTRLNSASGGCALDVAELTYLAGSGTRPAQLAIVASGLANRTQTTGHLERLFQDYTRPAVSSRLRQVLRFYLSSKTLPLARSSAQ